MSIVPRLFGLSWRSRPRLPTFVVHRATGTSSKRKRLSKHDEVSGAPLVAKRSAAGFSGSSISLALLIKLAVHRHRNTDTECETGCQAAHGDANNDPETISRAMSLVSVFPQYSRRCMSHGLL